MAMNSLLSAACPWIFSGTSTFLDVRVAPQEQVEDLAVDLVAQVGAALRRDVPQVQGQLAGR